MITKKNKNTKNNNKGYVEEMLLNYKRNKYTVCNLKMKLEDSEENLKILESMGEDSINIGSISYDKIGGKTNKFYSSVEGEVFYPTREGLTKEINTLKIQIRLMESKINSIDNALDSLDKKRRYVIEGIYFKGNTNREISIALNLTEQTICTYKKEAINQMECIILNKF